MSIDFKLIGERVKKKRKGKRMTQEKLAECLGVSVGYVSQIERGITKANLEMLSKISSNLNCDVTDLLVNADYEGNNFLHTEFDELISGLDSKQRKLVFEIITVLKSNMQQ